MYTAPRDLAFVSVEAVDRYDHSEIPAPSAAGYTGFLTDQEIVRYGLGNPYEEPKHQLLFKATFTTGTNLARFVRENGYNLGAHAYFCGQEGEEVFMSFVNVYWRGINVARPGDDPSQEIDEGGEQPTIYYFFLGVVRDTPFSPTERRYDLRRHPEDVCFYLSGGNAPFGFRSHVVTIPKETIAAALDGV